MTLNKPPILTRNVMRLKPEEMVAHRLAVHFLRHYPDVVYRFDLAADIPMSRNKSARIKAQYNHEKGYPDLFVAHPVGNYHGLYLELKDIRSKCFKKDGHLVASAHVNDQAAMLDKLSQKGYYAHFAWGASDVFEVVDTYLQAPHLLEPSYRLGIATERMT